METKKELQKEIGKCIESTYSKYAALDIFFDNIIAIVSRMPDDKSETKPEPSLLEVATNIYCFLGNDSTIEDCFKYAEKLIAENERRKNGK